MGQVVSIGATGEREGRRILKVRERTLGGLLTYAMEISKSWQRLSGCAEQDRLRFLEITDLSRSRIQQYVKVDKLFPAKQKLMGNANIEILGIEHLSEIVQTPDATLKLAAKAGMFQRNAIPKRDIRKLRQTGQVPVEKPKKITEEPPPKQIKYAMANAEVHMERAGRDLARILNLMEANDIVQVKGHEPRRLVKAFEKLCAQMAAASPKTSKRAFQILRGEA
jgi:hypothetical protein